MRLDPDGLQTATYARPENVTAKSLILMTPLLKWRYSLVNVLARGRIISDQCEGAPTPELTKTRLSPNIIIQLFPGRAMSIVDFRFAQCFEYKGYCLLDLLMVLVETAGRRVHMVKLRRLPPTVDSLPTQILIVLYYQ